MREGILWQFWVIEQVWPHRCEFEELVMCSSKESVGCKDPEKRISGLDLSSAPLTVSMRLLFMSPKL